MQLTEATKKGLQILKQISPFIARGRLAGSIRRKKPIVRDIDIVVELKPNNLDKLKNFISKLGEVKLKGNKLLKFIATDNVVICTPKSPMKLTSLFFIQMMINQVKWRYSYGRQCYKTKFAQTKIYLPVNNNGELNESFIEHVIKNTTYWSLIENELENLVIPSSAT